MIVGIVMLALAAAPLGAAEREEQSPLRMTISSTIFSGMSDKLITGMMQPFVGLLKLQTGLDGELVPTGNGMQIADSLDDNKLNIAVMEGIEFAWAREKHPDLQPLMIAVNKKPYGKSLLIVRNNGPRSFKELKGKSVADFRYTRVFSRLYLDRRAQDVAGVPYKKFFGRCTTVESAEELIDDVIEGKIDAAIVEEVCLECYQRRKPSRAKEVRVLEESESFPCSVVVYKKGKLDPKTRQRLNDGMLAAGKSAFGRHLMTLWQMTSFEPVPETFDTQCREIIKVYPSPEALKSAEAPKPSRATVND
jgi:ABC-type phosphate/phosphonate transport system substrate-binding protein